MSKYKTQYKLIDEFHLISLDVDYLFAVESQGKVQLITKGAVEEILSLCTTAAYKDKIEPLTKEIKENVKRISKKLNEDGFRVIAVCTKNDIERKIDYTIDDEKNMTLVGFIDS